MRRLSAFAGLFLLPCMSVSGSNIRPTFDNLSSLGGTTGNGFVTSSIQGDANLTKASGGISGAVNDGATTLEEFSVGQSFAPFTPYREYAQEEASRIRASLYPGPTENRAQVEGGGKPFRYLSLLYSADPEESDITSHFEQMGTWYGPAEQLAINAAIDELRTALAIAPLDTGLRNLLLDAYTDRAIAEMQFIKTDLVELGKKRLGLESVSLFIIDEEIEILERVTQKLRVILSGYGQLFGERMEGVEPHDFDPSVPRGVPFGYYVFQKQQPNRNQTPSRYFESENSSALPVPGYDENTESVVPRPANEILASGYKDYVHVLTILSAYVAHNTELARLRGLRQLPAGSGNPSDLDRAREEASFIARTTPNSLAFLRGMFPHIDFPPGDSSGVYAAYTGLETALADLTNTRAFLNGTANLLGLDPNFLILLQTQNSATFDDHEGNPADGFDSFSQIVSRLRGPNRPLTVALEKLDEASTQYTTFRESVDQVTEELKDVRVSFENRFREITGYTVGVDDGNFDGVHGKQGVGSELEQVQLDLQLLNKTGFQIFKLLQQFQTSERKAKGTLQRAYGLNQVVENAQTAYTDKVSPIYTGLTVAKSLAAGSQALADTTFAAAGVDGVSTFFSGGGNAIAIGVAGAINTVVQTAAAATEVQSEKAIDEAAKTYESALQKADNALTVSQAQDTVQDLLRERYSAIIEQQEVKNATTQARARQKSLLLELDRIQQVFETNTQAVRSRFHADPIHFYRSQNSILAADAAFDEAQRWMFYAQRALEHKWTQRFARVSGNEVYDSGSIFKMRNVTELDDLLTAYLAFDADRELGDVSSTVTSIISFKNHLLARNPKLSNLTDRTEDDLRIDFSTGIPIPVTQVELFRSKLRSFQDQDGAICVPFNTALLQDIEGLFRGPEYSSTGNINSGGQWRDKIIYVKFNIIAEDGPISGPGGFQPLIVNGAAGYGGLTIFRTRVVPCAGIFDRLTQNSAATQVNGEYIDLPGEFFVQPYRFYQSENLDNVFQVRDENTATGPSFAYSGRTARASGADPTQEDILGGTFQINDFRELSVAATRWSLKINANQPNLPGQVVDIDKIEDIELIIRHRASSRILPTNCP